MIDPNVYFNAALLVRKYYFCHSYACIAIEEECFNWGEMTYKNDQEYKKYYAEWFKPSDKNLGQIWYGTDLDDENQLSRELSLLFMHEIAKAGERADYRGKDD